MVNVGIESEQNPNRGKPASSGFPLFSAFGTLLSAYMRAIAEKAVGIAIIIRKLCYLISTTIVIISLTAIAVANYLSDTLDAIIPHIVIMLYLIVVLISITPIVISWRMYLDASA